MIDLDALRSLMAVQDQGSVAAAAARLGYTPSAVSQRIKKLERQTRTPLLERVGRRVILTERGRLLAERGVSLFEDLEALENFSQAPDAPISGTFRITSFSTACRGLVAPLLGSLRHSAPDLRVRLTENDPWDSLSLVAHGEADLAIVHNWNTISLNVPSSLQTTTLLRDQVDVLLPAGHRHARSASVTPRDLADETWVTTPHGTICHAWLLEMFSSAGLAVEISYYDSEYAGHVALVQQGVAAALVPRLGRQVLPEGVVSVRVTEPVPMRDVQAVWRRSAAANPALRYVLAELAVTAGR